MCVIFSLFFASIVCTFLVLISYAFSPFFFFFFFQAEDGIRDPLVTGVQTCALPISLDDRRVQLLRHHRRAGRRVLRQAREAELGGRPEDELFAEPRKVCEQHRRGVRSEERRVGKEWRSRWSPEHEKKKKRIHGKRGT